MKKILSNVLQNIYSVLAFAGVIVIMKIVGNIFPSSCISCVPSTVWLVFAMPVIQTVFICKRFEKTVSITRSMLDGLLDSVMYLFIMAYVVRLLFMADLFIIGSVLAVSVSAPFFAILYRSRD